MRQKILIVEFHRYHDEVLPSWCRAFHDLGFEVHVLMRKENWRKNAFVWSAKPNKAIVFQPWLRVLLKISTAFLSLLRYRLVVFNTVEPSFMLKIAQRFHGRMIATLHNGHLVHNDRQYSDALKQGFPFFSLAEFISAEFLGNPIRTLFPYYLSDQIPHPEAGSVRFCVQGNFEYGRRNYSSLIKALQRFERHSLEDFQVIFVGQVNPANFEHFQRAAAECGVLDTMQFVTGSVGYSEYFRHITSCHYLLTLLDPDDPTFEVYYRNSASSSISMSVGLGVVPIMDSTLAKLYGLDDIAITYPANQDLYEAMEQALKLSEQDRLERVGRLQKFRAEKLEQNAINLKTFLDGH
jgi:hypothetical protein